MRTLAITTVWPSDVPLPYVDYSGENVNATLSRGKKDVKISRRARATKGYVSLSLAWVLSAVEYKKWFDFYHETIGEGTAAFRIELRYPLNSAVKEWVVRFDGNGFGSRFIEGVWQVGAQIILLNEYIISDPATLEGWQPYFALPDPLDDSDVVDVPYETADGFTYSPLV